MSERQYQTITSGLALIAAGGLATGVYVFGGIEALGLAAAACAGFAALLHLDEMDAKRAKDAGWLSAGTMARLRRTESAPEPGHEKRWVRP